MAYESVLYRPALTGGFVAFELRTEPKPVIQSAIKGPACGLIYKL